jgi:hypothetical protein
MKDNTLIVLGPEEDASDIFHLTVSLSNAVNLNKVRLVRLG